MNIHPCFLLLLLLACQSHDRKQGQVAEPGRYALEDPDTVAQAPADTVMVLGKKVYESYCLACHQSNGSGVPGMYPPLSDSTWLTDREKLINIVLDGLSGKIVVNGESYNQMMPTHNFLKDEEVAAVLTYVRRTFGNIQEPVSPEEVKKLR